MASITLDGWVAGSTVTAHRAVVPGQSVGASLESQVASSTGRVTFSTLATQLEYVAVSGALRQSFMIPDRAAELRSLGIREPEATIIAALEAADDTFESQITEIQTLLGAGDLDIVLVSGEGTPEGVVVGSPGDVYFNESGGVFTTIYVKESGSATNTGWVALVSATKLAASGKGYVNHGAVAGTARPSGYASVEWVGSVEPTNAVNGDTWIDTVP